jgi:2,3,4,5-tetrahydropyridine-2-carboxylate N-succinyltransferase
MTLESDVGALWERYEDGLTADAATGDDEAVLDAFLTALETGEVRAAEKTGDDVTSWEANEWVKRGILLNFGLRATEPREHGGVTYYDVLPTLVDSCDTVGSCAQIGADVKLGANTLIGGVLEPIEDAPVVIEDGVSLGAGCRVTSGFRIGENSVVGENTLLTPRIPVYDLVDSEIRYGHLPANRRAFTRMVESSVGDHELFSDGAYKPAVVATDVERETLEATRQEDALRE